MQASESYVILRTHVAKSYKSAVAASARRQVPSPHSSRKPVRRNRKGFMKAETPSMLSDGAPGPEGDRLNAKPFSFQPDT